jgi:hypothetical protein
LENLEARQPPQPHEEPLDLSLFTREEQEILRKSKEIVERLHRTRHKWSRFGTENATEEDRRIVVAAARAVDRVQKLPKAAEVKQTQ